MNESKQKHARLTHPDDLAHVGYTGTPEGNLLDALRAATDYMFRECAPNAADDDKL